MGFFTPDSQRLRLRRRVLAAFVALACTVPLLSADAVAQTDEIEDLRVERDKVREERARATADLDPLYAENGEIEAALALLDDDLAAREAALDVTRAALAKAQADISAARQQVLAGQQRITDLRVELQRHAINAYVSPEGGQGGDPVLSAANLNDGARRRALILAVSTSRADVLDQLRAAEEDMELAVLRAQAAEAEIAARQRAEAEQVIEVQEAITRQQALKQILDDRIAEFINEIDGHEAEEDALTNEITSLIAEEEARQAAIREAARIKAERERVAREEARIAAERAAQIAAGITPPTEVVDRASAGLSATPEVSVSQVMWPVSGTVTSNFGPRWGRMHNGIDIAANTGTTILAAASGTVIGAAPSGGYGNRVLIDHGGGLVTLYGHLNVINVRNGQQVGVGSPIGTVGCTGFCTGPHLHFETRVNGVAYDPRGYLS